MAIQEGVWDCGSCDSTNRGRNIRCQGCGEARGEDVEFYLPDDAVDVAEDNPLFAQATAGADWICGYCDTSNRAGDQGCKGCGASASDGNHRQVREVPPAKAAEPAPAPAPPPAPRSGGSGCLKVFLAFLFVTALVSWWGSRTSVETMEVVGSSWSRTVRLQEFKTLQKQDWATDTPSDARVHSRENRHKRDRDVLVRTETRYRDVSRQVQRGSRQVKCGKIDMGNGYFKDKFCDEPIYETVHEEEPYEHRVYRKEPVYEDWVSYEVDRWTDVAPASLAGTDHRPVWPTPQLIPGKRKETGRQASYILKLKAQADSFDWTATEALFLEAPPGAKLIGEVNNFGTLTSVKLPGEVEAR